MVFFGQGGRCLRFDGKDCPLLFYESDILLLFLRHIRRGTLDDVLVVLLTSFFL